MSVPSKRQPSQITKQSWQLQRPCGAVISLRDWPSARDHFEDWLAAERERYRRLIITVYEKLMSHSERAGSNEESLAFGQKLLSLDPLRESVHRDLMRIYAGQNRSDAALAQFERLKRELTTQLDVRPEPQTEELARSIRSGRREQHSQSAPAQPYTAPPPLPDKPSIAVLPFENMSS